MAKGEAETAKNLENEKRKQTNEKDSQELWKKISEEISAESANKPVLLKSFTASRGVPFVGYRGDKIGDLRYCLYRGNIYKLDRCGYTEEEVLLQILDLEDEERRKFERLKHKFSLSRQEELELKRRPIPEEVRIAVWRRDDGKCAKCGSRQNLEYDHIIPLSKGGSTTVRNVELLCEKCNREKGANL